MSESSTTTKSGWDGTVKSGTFEFNITHWTLRANVKIETSRTSRTGHNTIYLPTFPDRTLTVEYDKDSANDATSFYGTTPIIYEGAIVPVRLVEDSVPAIPVGYDCPTVVIQEVMRDVVLDGKVTGRFTGKISGSYGPIIAA